MIKKFLATVFVSGWVGTLIWVSHLMQEVIEIYIEGI